MSLDIKSLRKSLGLTQEQLANALGVSWITVNRWERNKSRPSPLALEKLENFIARHAEANKSKPKR
jgi:putative transcriptional regulator